MDLRTRSSDLSATTIRNAYRGVSIRRFRIARVVSRIELRGGCATATSTREWSIRMTLGFDR
ncbi:MAG: hypothetical protein QOF87_2391, partial [Pseudonocardiales bacterium]|nr:hypothetical protein [Pseudonocardiales bacterium]